MPKEIYFLLKRYDIKEFLVDANILELSPASSGLAMDQLDGLPLQEDKATDSGIGLGQNPHRDGLVRLKPASANGSLSLQHSSCTLPNKVANPSNTNTSDETNTSPSIANKYLLQSDAYLAQWLQDLWARKEGFLSRTYAAIRSNEALPPAVLPPASARGALPPASAVLPAEWDARTLVERYPLWFWPMLVVYVLYWSAFLVGVGWLLVHSSLFRWYILVASATHVLVTLAFGGVDKLVLYKLHPHFTGVDVHVPQVAEPVTTEKQHSGASTEQISAAKY